MKIQKLRIKKLEKAKARAKDYKKKKNIVANRPSNHFSFKKPVFKQETDRKGVVRLVQIGEKEVRYSRPIDNRKAGISFPKSKKIKNK